jgi:hypothetical protein
MIPRDIDTVIADMRGAFDSSADPYTSCKAVIESLLIPSERDAYLGAHQPAALSSEDWAKRHHDIGKMLRNHGYIAIEIRWSAVVCAIADLILTQPELDAINNSRVPLAIATTEAMTSGLTRVVSGDRCATQRGGFGCHSCEPGR